MFRAPASPWSAICCVGDACAACLRAASSVEYTAWTMHWVFDGSCGSTIAANFRPFTFGRLLAEVLLAQYQNVTTKERRMDLADIVVCPRLGSGELGGQLGFWLDHLRNAKGFDRKAMRVI